MAQVACPLDSQWLRRMLEVLPPGLHGKLAAYEHCLENNDQADGRHRQDRRNGPDVIRPRLIRPQLIRPRLVRPRLVRPQLVR